VQVKESTKLKQHEPPFKLREIKIEVTQKCPLQCVHCSSYGHPDAIKEMSVAQCIKIIEDAASMGVEHMAFSGGEPLCWPALPDAIAKSCSLGINTSLYTSGNHPDSSTILLDLKNIGCKKAIFSIYGSNEEAHEKITTIPGSFKKTLESVEAASSYGMNPEFHFVPLSLNYQELELVVHLATELEVTNVSVLRFVPQGRGKQIKDQSLSKEQYIELKGTINRLLLDGHSIRTGSPFNILLLNDQPACCAGIDRITIGPDCNIFPCDAFKQIKAEELVGSDEYSSLAYNSLHDCWNQSKYLKRIREYLTTDFAEPCLSCALLEKCFSGCLAQKIIEYGDMKKHSDPWCLLNN
jgi:radical SAM protein with 4Fe4S-binding SPASM domain